MSDRTVGTLQVILAAGRPIDAGKAVIRLTRADMARLGVRSGDTVCIAGQRLTHARALPSVTVPDGHAQIEASTRANCATALGDPVTLRPADLPPAGSVTLRCDRGGATPEDWREALLDMPLTEGDRVVLRRNGGSRLDATVAAISPAPAARTTDATRMRLDGAGAPEALPLAGVGGMAAQIARIREMVELPIRRPDLFARLGLEPPRGVLFTGPPGSGKTLLARAVAAQSAAAFFQINGPEIVSKHYGDSEKMLREVFAAAARQAPAIVFIDEIDAIAPKRAALSGEKQLERRVVAQLLTLLDGLESRGQVVVIAATNLPDTLDPALRRPGRFDRELAFVAPDRAGREEILRLHLSAAPLAGDVDLAQLAAETHGLVGADLAALAREAGMAALARALDDAGSPEALAAESVEITAADLAAARRRIRPSALRETLVEPAEIGWADIGGLEEIKQALTEAVIWPLNHGETFRRFNLAPARGILLSGPPGGGKTLLAQALARESGVNFIPLRAASLLSQYLGEAERAVADVFSRARQAAPCILFMDELDALAPRRGSADAALGRVVAQLLIEIDGLYDNQGLFLLGATNRADRIDPALLRPGRFDLVLEMPAPDAAARLEILTVHCRDLPLDPTLELGEVAAATAGASGAELAGLARAAAQRALRRAVRQAQAGGPAPEPSVTMTDFDEARAALARSRHAASQEDPA